MCGSEKNRLDLDVSKQYTLFVSPNRVYLFKTSRSNRFFSEPHILTKEKLHGATANLIHERGRRISGGTCGDNENCGVGDVRLYLCRPPKHSFYLHFGVYPQRTYLHEWNRREDNYLFTTIYEELSLPATNMDLALRKLYIIVKSRDFCVCGDGF